MAKPLTSLVVMSKVAPETVPDSKALMSVTALGAAPDDPLEYDLIGPVPGSGSPRCYLANFER